jgi:hypothetical protein
MDARVNISNQEVFRLARRYDTDGSRTVGVITKCDALQAGDEKEARRTISSLEDMELLTSAGSFCCSKLGRKTQSWMVCCEESVDAGN